MPENIYLLVPPKTTINQKTKFKLSTFTKNNNLILNIMKNIWIVFLFNSFFSFAQWTDNPSASTVINASLGAKYVPKVVVSPQGNYFFSWYGGSGNLDMNLAYFDHSGVEIWEDGAMKVSTHPQNSWVDDYDLQCDNDGNAIVVFSDIRDGGKSVAVNKIDSLGNQLWGEDGVFFSLTGSDEFQPKASVAPDNSVYVFYSTNFSNGADNVIKIHRIEEDGTLSWGSSGKTFNNEFAVNWTLPSGKANEDNSLTIGFFRETGNFPATERWIKAFRCDTDGELIYPDAIVTNAGGISAWDDLKMFGPGDGSVYFTWDDDRYFNNTAEVYAQGVDASGNTLWTPSGELLGTETSGHQLYEIPAGVNNSGEFVVLWNRLNSNQSAGALVYQRVSQEGELMEESSGQTIISMSEQLQNGIGANQMGDSTFYAYRYFLQGSTFYTSLNMLALDSKGDMLWADPVEMVNSQFDRSHANLSEFNANQAVVCWSDSYLGSDRVMAQNIFVDGELGSSPVLVNEINEKDNEYFVCFLNTTNSLKIKNTETTDELFIYNLFGQEVYHEEAFESQHLNPFMKGTYIAVLIRNGKQLEVYKFFIN